MIKGKILYFGNFDFPDLNAAASRVITIGEYLKDLEYDVEYVTFSNNYSKFNLKKFKNFNIKYLNEDTKFNKLKFYTAAKEIINILKKEKEVKAIVLYNYPSLPFKKIIKFCKKNNIKVIADCTEWYVCNIKKISGLIKKFDVDLRMKKLNKKIDGIIVVSNYLKKYYENHTNVAYIPTISKSEINLDKNINITNEAIKLCFFGDCGYNCSKERLDIVIKALQNVNHEKIELILIGSTKEIFERKIGFELPNFVSAFGRLPKNKCHEILNSCDFSIIPREKKLNLIAGFPTKLSESFSCTVPVITTDVGDLSFYVEDGVNGYVLENCTIEEFERAFTKINSLTKKDLKNLKDNIDFNHIFNEKKFKQQLEKMLQEIFK